MSEINIKLDTSAIVKALKTYTDEIGEKIKESEELLAQDTYDRILSTAQKELGDSYSFYEENLSIDLVNGVWEIRLQGKAVFLEDGRGKGFMDYLLDGKESRVIPIKHSTNPEGMREDMKKNYATKIRELIQKKELQVGKKYTRNLESARPTPNASYPGLHGVQVKKDTASTGEATTFRVITKDHESQGKWFHPATQNINAFGKASEEAIKEWNDKVIPEIIKQFSK